MYSDGGTIEPSVDLQRSFAENWRFSISERKLCSRKKKDLIFYFIGKIAINGAGNVVSHLCDRHCCSSLIYDVCLNCFTLKHQTKED